ncbi:MAG: group II intron maturase-specific domain-containing protein [Methylocella sp.]
MPEPRPWTSKSASRSYVYSSKRSSLAPTPSPSAIRFRSLPVTLAPAVPLPLTAALLEHAILPVIVCVRGVTSPLLSNIVLDELDRELERRGLRFARYADDCNVYVRSRRAGERVMESITRFITAQLKLQVDQQKSAVARPWERKFLGFSFTNAGIPKRRIAPKAVDRFQGRVREPTRRTRGVSTERLAEELSHYLRGWIGYFGKCETPSVLEELERWFRRRLRSAIWKQWKRGSLRFTELRNRGVGKDLAAQTAGSAHGPWRLANSPALSFALPNAYFDSLGIPRLTGGR